jgi:hypothetical protein
MLLDVARPETTTQLVMQTGGTNFATDLAVGTRNAAITIGRHSLLLLGDGRFGPAVRGA